MTSSEFKRIARILKVAYKETEKEALERGADITSPQYEELLNIVRERILARLGYTLEEYREAKDLLEKERQERTDQRTKDLVEGAIRPVAESLPSKEEVTAIATEVAELHNKPPQYITQVVKETVVEKPTIVKETKVERIIQKEEYNDKPLWAEMGYLNDRIEKKVAEAVELIRKEIPIVDVPALKGELLNQIEVSAKKQIDILGMPDFRKLGMGLQQQIDEIKIDVDLVNTTSLDVEVTDSSKGLILESPDGTRWRLQAVNDGSLTMTSL